MYDLRAIAFYLPQFHPIAENDDWWGAGFTEWSNVTAASPMFLGHHQPQLPADLGFYDLRLADSRAAQAEIARAHGIHGFCYYRYWFEGRPLLERPFDDMLETGAPDFPFCVCWANENWTRRWDGRENDVLLAQRHSLEGDLAFLAALMPALKDKRYIRVDDKPLVLVYRTHLMADPRATAEAWRLLALREGLPGLYLARVESLQDDGDLDPAAVGFDAAVEFPPNGLPPGPPIARTMAGLDPAFIGHICDYADEAAAYMARAEPAYRRFSGVMPSWDNTARAGLRAVIRANARPDLFQSWLDHAAARTRARFAGDEKLIFVNAWNEWAEGCHLEPDRRFGRGFLEAVRHVLRGGDASAPIVELPPAEAKAALAAADTRAQALEAALAQRTQLLDQTAAALEEARETGNRMQARADHLETEIATRDRVIIERDNRIIERDTRIVERDHKIIERDARIAEREARIAERDRLLAERESELVSASAEIETLHGDVFSRENEIGALHQRLADADLRLAEIPAIERALHAALLRAAGGEAAAEHRASIIAALHRSTSWRITQPLRSIAHVLRRARSFFIGRAHVDRITLQPRGDDEFSPLGAVQWFEGREFAVPVTGHWLEISLSSAVGDFDVVLGTVELIGIGGATPREIQIDLVPGGAPVLVRITDPVTRARYAVTVNGYPEAAVDFTINLWQRSSFTLTWRAGRLLAGRPLFAARSIARSGLKPALGEVLIGNRPPVALEMSYQRWITAFDTLKASDVAAIKAHIARLDGPPKISIIVPVYDTEAAFLEAMIASVRGQIYPNWELCLADDASTRPHVQRILEQAARKDPRIKVTFRNANGHIAAASNSALALATGDFTALLDHDDVLPPHALYIVAAAIDAEPAVDILYSDEDKIDAEGLRFDPYFKPDFNRELVLGQNVVSHLGIYRTALLKNIGGFRTGFEGSQDYDLMLRAIEAARGPVIHLPWVLYHWRRFPEAATFSSTQMERAAHAARRAVKESLARRGIPAEVSAFGHSFLRVRRPDPESWPKVSVIIPTRDGLDLLKTSVDGVLTRTDYDGDLELIIADNDSANAETTAYFDAIGDDPRVRVVHCPGSFNFSRINNEAVAHATGAVLVLLNSDIEVIEPGWLKEMVRLAVLPDVGAVGAKLLYVDGTLQHGGVVLGLFGVAGHFQIGVEREDPGYFASLSLPRDVSAVTAACVALRREVFDEAGGLDETNLAVAFNDVDLCLKITELGYRIVWTPFAELYHHESKSRGSDLSEDNIARFKAEISYMRRRWGHRLDQDPMFNPNLSLTARNPALAFPPRRRKPWLATGT